MTVNRRRGSALLLVILLAGPATSAAQAWRAQLDSPRIADQEEALLQLGDAGLPDSGDVQAAAARLADPVAAVRWNAVAALRKAGPAATPLLLARVADGRQSAHLGSYESGCGRATFVPSVGELAAATLASSPHADGDAIWASLVDGSVTGDVARLLSAALRTMSHPPPPPLLRNATQFTADVRDLLFRLANVSDPRTLDSVAALLDTAGPQRTPEAESSVARLLIRAGDAGLGIAMRGLASSRYPEAWLATANDGWPQANDALVARAFEAAVGSGRPEALSAATATLSRAPLGGRGADSKAPTWLGQVSPRAMRAFLAQRSPMGPAEIANLAGAAQRIAAIEAWRPAVIDLMTRLAVAASGDHARTGATGALEELVDQLAPSMGPAERHQAWAAMRGPLAARAKTGVYMDAVLARLPPPAPDDQPALARLLVAAVLEGRVSLATFGLPGHHAVFGAPPALPDDMRAWRAELLAAVPAMAPGREGVHARLLAALGAEPGRLERAWLAAEASPQSTAADVADALAQLMARPETAAWARDRLMQRLHAAADRATAAAFADALWGRDLAPALFIADSEEERQRRADALEAAWAAIVRLPVHSPARSEVIQRLFAGKRYELWAPIWWARAAEFLGTADADADDKLLAYLADEAPDVSAQTLPCDSSWRYENERPRAAAIGATLRRRLTTALRPALDAGGHTTDLALRVWRGFGLPSDPAIKARVREAEAEKAATCPTVGSAATLEDLATTLALPAGDPTRAARFEELMQARAAPVACGAVAALGGLGADAVPGAATMLRQLIGAEARETRDRLIERVTCGERQPIVEAFAQGLARLDSRRRRAVLDRALLTDRPWRRAAGARSLLPRTFLLPGWQPWPEELESASLERGEPRSWRYQIPRELLTALADVADAALLERLEAGPPGPGWVQLAEGHWLRDAAGSEPVPQVSRHAQSALPALARHWPLIGATERARLLPLLQGSDPQDAKIRGMLDLSLENPTGGERAAALQVTRQLWPDNPRLAALERAELVARSLAWRLESRLDRMFEVSRGAARSCHSSISSVDLPGFPWPPPPGYRPPEPLALDWFGPPGTTAGAWHQRVRETLRELSTDYETGLFGGPPGGFALVARIERIDALGRPFPGRARWTTEGQPKLDLADLLGDLFLERPGYFRIIVFVVTDQPVFQPDPQARLPDVRDGAAVMPEALSAMPLDGKHILALVYSFERRPGEPMQAWLDGSPSSVQHLMASGIWERLRPPR